MYYLQKELGLSHADIFGGQRLVQVNGRLEQVETTGMNIFTFMAYVELMQMDAEEREEQQKKARRDAKMGNSKIPN